MFYHPPGGGKEVEIWNLVFTQFNREGDPPDNLKPLPSKNIDTGMGLERAAATLQGVETNYHIDILKPIVDAAAQICGVNYVPASDDGRRLRRITDHIRACSFAIHENVYPGAAKEEYVVRRLLRRAILDGHQMGMREPRLYQLVTKVAEMMRRPYPELSETIERVSSVIKREEETFLGSIDEGLARVERIFADSVNPATGMVYGRDVADLYQTYGVPPELFEAMAIEKGFTVDWDGYRDAMDEHSKTSGKIADTVMGNFGPIDELKKTVKSTKFVGYETTEHRSEIVGVIVNDVLVGSVSASDDRVQIVLAETPFYSESGGQVGDTGSIRTDTGAFRVDDTQRDGELVVHRGVVVSGTIEKMQLGSAVVDPGRRDAIRRAHSATHILHHALQTVLGEHAQQRGSKVSDDWLRFDFTNMQAVTADELARIEELTNARIHDSARVTSEVLPLSEARKRGAMMLFGEKYPDPVRMISIGDFSRELCGGTHLSNSGEVGLLEIQSEEGVSAGTRRIEAITGERARSFRGDVEREIESICKQLQVEKSRFPEAVLDLSKSIKDLKKQISSGKSGGQKTKEHSMQPIATDYVSQRNALRETARTLNIPMFSVADRVRFMLTEQASLQDELEALASKDSISADDLWATAVEVDGAKLIVAEVPGANPGVLRQLVDQLRDRQGQVAIFLGSISAPDKVMLLSGVSKSLVEKGIRAGDWIKAIAPIVGGGGGGKPDFAQAGGKQPEKLKQALEGAKEHFISLLVK
ncbi:MAG: alanine--tRNA ligase [Pirellulaceae bacterium]